MDYGYIGNLVDECFSVDVKVEVIGTVLLTEQFRLLFECSFITVAKIGAKIGCVLGENQDILRGEELIHLVWTLFSCQGVFNVLRVVLLDLVHDLVRDLVRVKLCVVNDHDLVDGHLDIRHDRICDTSNNIMILLL